MSVIENDRIAERFNEAANGNALLAIRFLQAAQPLIERVALLTVTLEQERDRRVRLEQILYPNAEVA